MKVSNYLPNLYNKNKEMLNIIYSEEDELENNMKPGIEDIFSDTFIKTATKNGIEDWENLLNIKLDSNKDNIEYRRAKVLTKLSTTVPLTYKWLENNLIDLVGVNNYFLNLDNENYLLEIQVSDVYRDTAETIYNLYRPLIPANLSFVVNTIETHQGSMKFGGITLEGEYITIKSEEEDN